MLRFHIPLVKTDGPPDQPSVGARRCLIIRSLLRFHIPLIEPDVRISRIRLSDKDSCVRPRQIARLTAPPWTEPIHRVSIHAGLGLCSCFRPFANQDG